LAAQVAAVLVQQALQTQTLMEPLGAQDHPHQSQVQALRMLVAAAAVVVLLLVLVGMVVLAAVVLVGVTMLPQLQELPILGVEAVGLE
jgi:Flp pilus assembly protein TadB